MLSRVRRLLGPTKLAVDSRMMVFQLQTGQMAGFGNTLLVSLSVLVLVIGSYANPVHEESTMERKLGSR
jgi:hypothetical protein